MLSGIENLEGSGFNDTLTGNAAANGLEGGLGNDVIYGGDGNDVIYGSLYTQLGPFAVNVAAGGPQADLLYGGTREIDGDFWDRNGRDLKSWQEGGRTYYEPTTHGLEARIKERLDHWRTLWDAAK